MIITDNIIQLKSGFLRKQYNVNDWKNRKTVPLYGDIYHSYKKY